MQGNDNLQLRRKFHRKETFFREMQSISKKYFQLEQQVYYAPITDINPHMILHIENKDGKLFKRQDFYVINGQYQPNGDRSFQKLILQIVQTIPRYAYLQKRPQKPFGVIYVNTLAAGDAYNDFKKVMQLLPFQYLSNLTKIYVLQPSFINKALFWLSFGTITNYIKNKTVNIDTLQQLANQSKFDLQLLKKILPKNVIEQLAKSEPKPQPQKSKKQGQQYRSLLRQAGHSEVEVPKSLGHHSSSQIISGEQPKKSSKKLLTDYEFGPTGAPMVLQLLIYFFDNRQEALQVEGLFRKSVSIDDQIQILAELQKKNYNYLQTVTNPHVIANAIKRFLSNFRVPVIPYETFEILMARDTDPNYRRIVIQSIQKLAKPNKMTLFLLFSFLREKVLPHQQQSKMGENNLCIVFGPCLMKAEVPSIRDLLYAKKVINATSIILHEFEAIFGDEHSRNLLRRNSYVQYRKEDILQKLSSTPTKEKEGECALDRTSDYVKDALKEKEETNDYLDIIETEEAIHHIPHIPQHKTTEISKPQVVNITPQQETLPQKLSKATGRAKDHHFTQI